jgi:hypothetical protein
MGNSKFKINDQVRYIGKLNNWTYDQDIKPNQKGIITKLYDNAHPFHYEVNFETGLLATISEDDIELLQ